MRLSLSDFFGPGGALSARDPGYEQRPQQAAMAEAVLECLRGSGRLVVEAGTGVGKSLGYLVPGALWALESGGRLLVATHTRALQEQLLHKELPALAEALRLRGVELRYAMLMGAENYLCVERLERLRREPEFIEGAESGVIEELAAWSKTAETGHRSALPRLVPQNLWSRLCRDPDLCLGPQGSYWQRCLYRRDREAAERAHVLVVNHALLLSGARLPDYDALVVDEAHNFEEAAAARFGLRVSQAGVLRLLREIGSRGFLGRLKDPAPEPLSRCAGALDRAAEVFDGYFKRVAEAHRLDPRHGEPAAKRFTGEGGYDGAEPLRELERALRELTGFCAGAEQAAELKSYELRVSELRGSIDSFLGAPEPAEGTARWVEGAHGSVELRCSPLEVGARLSEALYSRGIPVVMTSATLSSGDGLREFKAAVGFSEARELVLDSPFDYRSQAALLVLDHLPAPKEEEAFAKAVAAECRKVIAAVPGGIFILFSSWKSLRRVHGLLRGKARGRPLWAQGAAGSEALLAEFSAAGNAILLGVDTFWQGVDVPGSALSAVVLVKLPFPNFGSPIEEARREYYEALGRGYFEAYSLPRAVMKFRQGFGRLIRSAEDRGAVLVLDSRVSSKGYGAAFLEALPPCRRLESLADLKGFFSAGRVPRRSAAKRAP